MNGLTAVIHREVLLRRIPRRYHRARFQRYAGMPAEIESSLDHVRGSGEAGIDIAFFGDAFEHLVVAKFWVENRRVRVEGSQHVGDRSLLCPIDGDVFGRILSDGTGSGDDGDDRFALPGRSVDGERILRCRFQRWLVFHNAGPGRHLLSDLATCDDSDHTPLLGSRRRVDLSDIGVGVWAPHIGDLDRTGEVEIVDVTPLTGYCAASH